MENNKKNILFVGGSLNQTTQLHQISKHLEDKYNVYFTQIYGEGWFFKLLAESGIFDNTVLGKNSNFTKDSKQYIKDNNINYDYRGNSKNIKYDMAILSTDMIVPISIRKYKTVWVQEGMIDPITPKSLTVKRLRLPNYLTGDTSLNGTSNMADIYFAMSKGYKKYFSKYGTDKDKILCTGIPNFDDIKSFQSRPFEKKGFVLVATSDIRELGGNEDRIGFIKKCKEIKGDKHIIFKPHPNEKSEIVTQEFLSVIPEAEVITAPILDTLIAHCDTFITQYSSSAYVGLVLGKKVYSYFPIDELEEKAPIQNGGQSAKIIARICADYIEYEGAKEDYLSHSKLISKFQ